MELKNDFLKKYFVIWKILVAPLVCYLGLHLVINELFLYPLIFGLFVGLINYNKSKKRNLFGLILSLLLSYVTFFLAYFSIVIYRPLLGSFLSDDQYQQLGIIVTISIVSPLLVYMAYGFIYPILEIKYTFIIIFSSILILVFQSYYIYNYEKSTPFYLTQEKILLTSVIWQMIMALSLQLIIYQKEVFRLKA